MDDILLKAAYEVGHFFVSDIYAYYLDTYKGILGKVQVEVLDYLNVNGQASVMELADKLNISKQHASKILLKLEADHYVKKEQSPKDGRFSFFTLTHEGECFVKEHILKSNSHFLTYISPLNETEKEKVTRALLEVSEIIRSK